MYITQLLSKITGSERPDLTEREYQIVNACLGIINEIAGEYPVQMMPDGCPLWLTFDHINVMRDKHKDGESHKLECTKYIKTIHEIGLKEAKELFESLDDYFGINK